MLCSECFVISNWYHSPCLSWDPPKEDDSGRVALLGRGATGDEVTKVKTVSKFLERQQEVRRSARANMERAVVAQQKYYNQKH